MIHLEQEGPVRIVPIKSFEDAGLHPAMAKNVELAQYKVPTPIQKFCIPAITAGHDVIGIAQTGKIPFYLRGTGYIQRLIRSKVPGRLLPISFPS